MPILPPSGNAPLDTVTQVMNAARVKLAQKNLATLESASGKLLDWTIAGSQQLVNSAWRQTQQGLANVGFTQLKQDLVIPNIPIVTTQDPAVPQSLSWTGCFDGTNLLPNPYLPFDLRIPLKLWERPSGQNAPFPSSGGATGDGSAELIFDGLRMYSKQSWNGQWEWRAGAIYFPGALQSVDFRLLYQRMFGDFADDATTHWYDSVVPISDCQDAFSGYICAGIMGTPENPNAGGWLTAAEEAVKRMVNREAAMKLRGNIRRQSRSGRLESGW